VKVLVVDDAPAVRARVVGMLGEISGACVAEAASVSTALLALASEEPDLVVIDLHLAGESGLDVVVHARRERPAALLVVLTNDPSEHHRRRCALLGVDFFFDKSRDFDRLLEIVRQVAEGEHGTS
jgi:DNA-binding NarL/FixJ family response regulator